MNKKFIFVFAFFMFCAAQQVFAEEIILKNGDRISGSILNDTKESITVHSQALGTVMINRAFIDRPAYDVKKVEPTEEKKKDQWNRKISLGYNKAGGNTVKSEADGSLSIDRKTDSDEWSAHASAYYSSADRQMDAQKYYGMIRYAFSFGENKKWYNFYRLEGDHDRFSDIDYRLIPATGVGYWFSDQEEWKLLAEMAGGLEYTNYRSAKDSTEKFVAIPRGYLKKLLVKDLWVEQELIAYVVADDLSKYRLRSETSLIHTITKQLSWKLSLVDEFDSDPASGAKDNDYRLISSVDYSF